MAFKGWPAEALDFFEGLEADNSRTYWTANKQVYEEAVLGPMQALLAELASEFGEGKVFRPYRDLRFSKDKAPYKTSISATLSRGGYVSLSVRGLGVGTGMYVMAPDQLERYRAAVAEHGSGAALAALVSKLAKKEISIAAHGMLKTAPKGYAKDHPRIDLLRQKGLTAWRDRAPGEWLGTKAPERFVTEVLRTCVPLNSWLAEHVGPSVAE